MSVWFAWIVPVLVILLALFIYIALFHSKKYPGLDGKFFGHAAQDQKTPAFFWWA